MRDVFHEHLDQVSERLVTMCSLATKAMADASTALFSGDLALAETVIAADNELDTMRADLDDLAVDLLARQQPVATDLRMVVTAMHMSTDLERMGDLAEHIAKVTRMRYPEVGVHPSAAETLSLMGNRAVQLGQLAGKAIEAKDSSAASHLDEVDNAMDDLHKKVFDLLDQDWQGTVGQAVDVTLLSRYFERYGDHAVTVARRVQYLVTGEWPISSERQPTV